MEYLIERLGLKECKIVEGIICGYTETELNEFLTILAENGQSFSRRSSKNQTSGKFHFCYRLPHAHDEIISCDNLPFEKIRYINYQCCNGPLYYKTSKDKPVEPNVRKTRFYVQPSKKMQCEAVMTIDEVKYAISKKYQIDKNKLHNWRAKKKVIDSLKEDMKNPDINVEFRNRFLVRISTNHGHDVQSSFLNQTLDIHLKEQIYSCVLKGIHDVAAIRNILNEFVAERYPNVPTSSKAFYPEDRAIYNHVLKFSYKSKKSKIDQQALQIKVEEWQKDPNKQIFYRPYAEDEDGSVDSFIFCFQEKWQQELLLKYGSLSFLDATYKTVKYNLPLFLLVIRSNISYIPVGIFIVQNETAESIEEALKIFQSWNVDWKPTYFLTDFSDAEIKAICSTFDCKNLICSFHREQAWTRWLKKKENSTNSAAILAIWRKIAKCQDVVELEDLISSAQQICSSNKKALAYFNSTWLPHIEKWCDAYFEPECYLKIRTNNGVENMNRTLKHAYLKRYTDRSVTGLMIVIIGKFLPDQLKRYIGVNSKLTEAYKRYNADLPQFLHNRPLYFIRHVYCRYLAAKQMCGNEGNSRIIQLEKNSFLVKSENDEKSYFIDFGKPYCDCIDFNKYLLPCKHLCAIFITQPNHSFSDLPESYLQNPFFILDKKYNVFNENQGHELQPVASSLEPDTLNTIVNIENTEEDIQAPNQVKLLTDLKITCKCLLDAVYCVDKNKIDNTFTNFNFMGRIASVLDDLKKFKSYDDASNLPLVITSPKKRKAGNGLSLLKNKKKKLQELPKKKKKSKSTDVDVDYDDKNET